MVVAVDAPPAGLGADPTVETRVDTRSEDRRRDANRDWIGLVAVVALALVLDCVSLSRNGLGNTYYAAAARSMSTSWHNFFFASFDPGGFITVDKPPVALWFEALSARAFGYSSWSLLLPSAIAGAASVGVLWATVRRRFGVVAATISGFVLAVSPINVAVNRLNLPDPFMVLFLLLAAWAAMRAVERNAVGRWLVLAGVFVGLAFNTKMLAAYVVVPALALGIAIGISGSWRRRLGALVLFGAVALAASAPWIVAVDLTPASSRPYVGGSTDNTELDLVLGYNGLGRVDGVDQGGGGGAAAGRGSFGGPGGIFGGSPGWLRMWNDANGGQIAWLLPLAGVAAVAALWRARRDRKRLANVAMWTGWVVVQAVVFSLAKGTFHSYYTSALAPGVAALVGIGGVALAALAARHSGWLLAAVSAVAVTTLVELQISNRAGAFFGWTRGIALVGAAVAVCGFIALATDSAAAASTDRGTRGHRAMRIAGVSGLVALVALTVMPAAWASSEVEHAPLNASLPQAGPRGGAAGQTFGSNTPRFSGDPELAAFLRSQRDGERWDLVVTSAQQGSSLIASDQLSVMALGGFLGTDPAASVSSIADLVAAGKVRFFEANGGLFFGGGGFPSGGGFPGGQLPGGGGFPGSGRGPAPGGGFPGGGRGFGGGGGAGAIMRAVEQACSPLTSASTGGALPAADDDRVYDCQGKADAIRAAG